ncbi:MAG: hypothetical protein A4E49_00863 [Methanosaeta sp. PtaU1.Bin112]|nr:MAG: hypothetical protein A4E49_00863 [Methanosaeta sp. PtaU1.Bin112]
MSCRTDLRMEFAAIASIEQTVAEERPSSVISSGLRLLDPAAGTGAFPFLFPVHGQSALPDPK